MKVEISDQVLSFIRSCAPEPRNQLRAALRKLEKEQGDIKALEGPLENFYRLRVGSFRIIFRYHQSSKTRSIQCIFAERRSIVYETLLDLLR